MRTIAGNKEPLYAKIANILKTEIRRSTQAWFPSIRRLCLRHNVSFVTMQRAIKVLEKEGLIAVSQGRRISVLRQAVSGGQSQNPDTTITRLAQQINETIQDGLYRIGQFLPKYMHYALGNHVSTATVAQAYALLDEKKIIHKSGRRWVVGPPPTAYAHLSIAKQGDIVAPTVLMLMPKNALAHEDLYSERSEHLRPFLVEFLSQMAQFNIRCLLVQNEPEPSAKLSACGRKEILALIQSRKDHFLGTLIPVQSVYLPDIKEWIEWLLQFKKPVVWFDFADNGGALDRKAIPRDEYYRCCSNESAMVDLVLETCSRLGHRTLGCPLYAPYANEEPGQWFQTRKAYLEQAVKKRYPNLSLTFPSHEEPLWAKYDPDYSDYGHYGSGYRTAMPMLGHIDFCTRSLRERHQNMPEQAFKALLQKEVFASVPSLLSLVEDKDVTAILAPNQWLAINYMEWLTASGIQVPDELSLVSFDNYHNYCMYPTTVIDQGFGDLGYKSAHIFIKDITVQADKSGRITCNPKLIDKGSLGRARQRGRCVPAIARFRAPLHSSG
jgi:DNA-binding GntR family transcriptional regulator